MITPRHTYIGKLCTALLKIVTWGKIGLDNVQQLQHNQRHSRPCTCAMLWHIEHTNKFILIYSRLFIDKKLYNYIFRETL